MKEIYCWIGFALFWLGGFLIVGALAIFLSNLVAKKVSEISVSYWYLLEYVFYRKDFLEWVKNKTRHPKIVNRTTVRFDSGTFKAPFRVGIKQGKMVLDAEGKEVVFFKHSKKQATLYCDYLNSIDTY